MKKLLLLTGVASVLAFNAQALEFKPYVGADYVYSKADIEGDAYEDSLNAYSLSVGAKFHDNFGLEAFYQQSEDGESSDNTLGATIKTEDNYKAYGVDLIGYLPVGESQKFQLLGSVGVGQYEVEAGSSVMGIPGGSMSDEGLGIRVGAGVQYDFNDHFAVRTMARYTDIDVPGVSSMADVTAGIRYTF